MNDVKLDMSQFHPLDHNLWQCRGYPGGRRRHVEIAWDYVWRPEIKVHWRHLTGRHLWRAMAVRDPKTAGGFGPPPLREGPEAIIAAGWSFRVVCEGCGKEPDWVTADRIIVEQWGPR